MSSSAADLPTASTDRVMLRARVKAMKQAASQYKAGDLEAFYETLTVMSFRNSRISVTLADPNLPDCPLVGISEGFEELTGYSRGEIIGSNCRFLNRSCPMGAETRHRLRMATRTLTGFTGILVNRRKSGELFRNLLHMSMLRVGTKTYILGVQADATNSDVDLRCAEHLEELSRIMDNIFAANVDTWAALQVSDFGSAKMGTFARYTESQLMPGYDSEEYMEAREAFVSLAPTDGLSTTVGSHNTFIEVRSNELLLKGLRHVSSEPALSSPATAMGASVPDSMRLPEHLLRDSLRQMRLGAGPVPPRDQPPEADADMPTGVSEGSVNHPDGCTPCAFFCYSTIRCNKGLLCIYCHMAHPRRQRRRRRKKIEGDPDEDLAQVDEDVGEKALSAPTPLDLKPLLSALQLLSPLPAACEKAPDHPVAEVNLEGEAEPFDFWYSERLIVLALGQWKQVIPFLRGSRKGQLAFSVSPPLPTGWSLCRQTGVISGCALQLGDLNGREHTITVVGGAESRTWTTVHIRVVEND